MFNTLKKNEYFEYNWKCDILLHLRIMPLGLSSDYLVVNVVVQVTMLKDSLLGIRNSQNIVHVKLLQSEEWSSAALSSRMDIIPNDLNRATLIVMSLNSYNKKQIPNKKQMLVDQKSFNSLSHGPVVVYAII